MFRIMNELMLDMNVKVNTDVRTGEEVSGKIVYKTLKEGIDVLECKVSIQEDNPGKFKAIFRPIFSREEIEEISKDPIRFKSIGCLVLKNIESTTDLVSVVKRAYISHSDNTQPLLIVEATNFRGKLIQFGSELPQSLRLLVEKN